MGRLLLLAAALSLSATQQPRPVADVPGAVALLESHEVPTLIVRFTNLGDVGLQSLDFEVSTRSGVLSKSWNARTSPLGTGGTGEMAVAALGDERSLPVKVTLAIFADGTVQGEPAEVARVQALLTATAEDLSAWRDALSAMPRTPQSEAFAFLRATIERRKTEQPTDTSGMRRLVEVWVREERAPGFVSAVVDTELKNIDMRMSGIAPVARAARLPQKRRPVGELVQAVTTAGSTREFIVKVRNHRDVPLEAWAAAVSDSQSGRPLRMIGHDAGVDLRETGAATGIPAGGVMDIGTYQPDSDFASGLRVHLEFAMWQDLVWQGFEVNQQRILANRERRAEEYEFFLGSLRTAAGLPAPQALELLEGRQREFSQGPLGRQSSGLQNQLENWKALATTAPQLLSGQLNTHAAALERSRSLLLRHRQK